MRGWRRCHLSTTTTRPHHTLPRGTRDVLPPHAAPQGREKTAAMLTAMRAKLAARKQPRMA